MHKGLRFQPERGEQRKFGGYCNWCWRIGDKEAQCWFKQEYMKSKPSQDRCKETFANGQTRQRKGKVTASSKVKVKVKARARENIQEKGTTIRTRLDLRMKKLDSARWVIFGIKRQRVEFVGDVQDNDHFETPRLDRAAYVFCVRKCKSVVMDSTGLPSSSTRVFDGNEEPAGTPEKFDQSTGKVLFAVGCRDDRPIVDSGSVVSTCLVDFATV